MRHHWADEGRARAASHAIHQLTPRVLQNAGSGKVVVDDLPTAIRTGDQKEPWETDGA